MKGKGGGGEEGEEGKEGKEEGGRRRGIWLVRMTIN